MRSLHQQVLRLVLIVGFLASTSYLTAQAGPPFRTDDPDTPGNGNWEINFGFVGDHNPQISSYETPNLDINYGLGDRIQLKYELPLAIAETHPQPTNGTNGSVVAGLGDSLLGVKLRFFEHYLETREGQNKGDKDRPTNFGMSIYPQLSLSNPTRSVQRGVVEPGPDFLLPLEVNARVGPIRIDGEFGYHFGNHAVAQSWIRGLVVGHEFSDRLEAYLELYDEHDANVVFATGDYGNLVPSPKERETTLGFGGRYGLNRSKSLVLLAMGGRSLRRPTVNNSQPSWIAYVGLQLQFRRRR
jgi:hypothetical protein